MANHLGMKASTLMSSYLPRISLLLGFVLGIAFLYAAAPDLKVEKRFENLALGEENTVAMGGVVDIRVHCHDLDDIDLCLNGYKQAGNAQPVVLWLGNSQVHAINHYRPGEETAAPELHGLLQDRDRYFLTLSQPNANLQEHYLLFAHLVDKLPVKTLVLPVVFDDMREEGVRTSLAAALKDPDTRGILGGTPVGQSLVANHGDQDAAGNDMAALADTVQEYSERRLNEGLERVWPLWAERPELRGEFLLSLYLLRNWVLGIDPSSTRKMIPGRYANNREAFQAILDLAGERGIDVLVYVVPLRNDVKVPYDLEEYAAFKAEMATLADRPGVRFANLEDLVPADLWGAKAATTLGGGEELDFMHFQAGGHRLLAAALYHELQALWGGEVRP